MDFTASEVEAIASALLDHHVKTAAIDSAKFAKPTLERLIKGKKTFNATKGDITMPVRLEHGNNGVDDGLEGIGPADELKFYNPSNLRRARYTRRKHHIGVTMTEDELEDYGINIVDEMGKTSGGGTAEHAQIADALKEKMVEFDEQHDEELNTLIWGDGLADSKALSGIRSIILDDPTQGTVGGLSCALNPKWRNRAHTAAHGASGGTGAITSNTAGGGELMQVLTKDARQLARFGGRVTMRPSGSDFLDALEREVRANGKYSESGFGGVHNIGVGEARLDGMVFYYDPELDNMGRAKWSYAISGKNMKLMCREGLWKKVRNPARPYNRFVIHKSLVSTCQLTNDQMNGHAVYQIT